MADDAPSPVADLERPLDQLDAFMEADQLVMHLAPGHVLTAEDVGAIKLVTDFLREDGETVVDAYSRGIEHGRLDAAGAETAALLNKIDELHSALAVEKGLSHFYQRLSQQQG